jgi:FtsH-binding integral membrane protein
MLLVLGFKQSKYLGAVMSVSKPLNFSVSQWMLIVSMICTIGVMFALFWKARSYPLNYVLLTSFTLLEAHAVGTIGKKYDQGCV